MKTQCFIIMPRAYVGFDTVTPFITCLKEYNEWEIHCIFLNISQFKQLELIPSYAEILKENSNIYILKSGSIKKLFYSITNIFIKFLFSIQPRVITIGGETKKGKIRKLIKLFSTVKGRYYVLPNYNAPMNIEFFENYYSKALCDNNVRKMLGKEPGKFYSYVDKKLLGELLLQGKFENKRADFFGHPKQRRYLGYFKIHKPWLKQIANNNYIQNTKLKNATECVFLITKKAGKYFFDSDSDYLDSINESIKSIRSVYPNILIVLKPKPFKTTGANDWIVEYVESLNDNQIIVDYTPLTFSAQKAIFAIFNIASTAYFDFAIHNVPCIEHAHYGKTYYQINPNGSFMTNFGAINTSSKKELVEAITKIKNQSINIFGQASIISMLGHKENKDGFKRL